MPPYSRVGIVTGANKGIGLGIVRQVALQYPSSPLNNGPLLIYLTARDKSRGEAALNNLHQDAQLKKAQALQDDGGLSTIKFHALDITSESSIDQLITDLKQEHGNQGIDFIINNAGIALNGFDANIVKQTLACNYHATLSVCHKILPLLKPSPQSRIVNVASSSGHLSKYSPSIRQHFLEAKSQDEITAILTTFAQAVEQGREKDAGFPSAAYAVSKAGLIGGTRVFARQVERDGGQVVVNSCCPGYVNTDMTKGNGTKSTDEGAETPVLLALRDLGGIKGEFWRDGKIIEW